MRRLNAYFIRPKDYFVTVFAFAYVFHGLFCKREIYCIFQRGKVGSSTVLHNFKKWFKRDFVFQSHNLSQEGLCSALKWHQETGNYIPFHLHVSYYFLILQKYRPKKIIYISIIRNPLEAAISAFFEMRENHLSDGDAPSIEELKGFVKTKVLEKGIKHFDQWFEQEVKGFLKIELSSFKAIEDRKDDYVQIPTDGKVEFFLMKNERLNSALLNFVRKRLNCENKKISIESKNVGSKKSYSDEYAKIKKELLQDKDCLEYAKNSWVYKVFYSTDH